MKVPYYIGNKQDLQKLGFIWSDYDGYWYYTQEETRIIIHKGKITIYVINDDCIRTECNFNVIRLFQRLCDLDLVEWRT